jgi:hypothetical protein
LLVRAPREHRIHAGRPPRRGIHVAIVAITTTMIAAAATHAVFAVLTPNTTRGQLECALG